LNQGETAPAPNWDAWRAEFPGLQQRTYLNTVSLGQLSRRSRAAVNRFLDLWTEYGASAWYSFWLQEVNALRGEFARLINASIDEIAILPNISSALAAVASCLDYQSRPRVVSCELDFPTVPYHFQARSREGVESVLLASPDRVSVPLEDFARAIDQRTALVATCRVYFTSGYIQDIKALAEMAHDQEALLLVDDYQGTGQLPIDVKSTGVDFLVTGGLKWLLGGPGVAYLYVRRELAVRLQPRIAGWFGHRRQFDFDPHTFEYRPDAARFEAGTPAVAAFYAGKAGLEIINEIGPAKIRRRAAALNQDLVSRLRSHGYRLRIPADPDRQASITLVELADPMLVTRQLAERGIIVDKRPGVIRISPYFYNTLDENEIIVQALDDIVTPQDRD
jgi:selenocysteine lyase/cysteine desulfurase